MSELTQKYPWQQAVLDALMELQPDRQRDKITAAKRAVSERLLRNPKDLDEQLALKDALFTFEMLFPKKQPKAEPNDKKEIA